MSESDLMAWAMLLGGIAVFLAVTLFYDRSPSIEDEWVRHEPALGGKKQPVKKPAAKKKPLKAAPIDDGFEELTPEAKKIALGPIKRRLRFDEIGTSFIKAAPDARGLHYQIQLEDLSPVQRAAISVYATDIASQAVRDQSIKDIELALALYAIGYTEENAKPRIAPIWDALLRISKNHNIDTVMNMTDGYPENIIASIVAWAKSHSGKDRGLSKQGVRVVGGGHSFRYVVVPRKDTA